MDTKKMKRMINKAFKEANRKPKDIATEMEIERDRSFMGEAERREWEED